MCLEEITKVHNKPVVLSNPGIGYKLVHVDDTKEKF